MAFPGRDRSRTVTKAEGRAKTMELIDTNKKTQINYGSVDRPLTAVTMRAQIKVCDDKLDLYNSTLKTADNIASELNAEEDALEKMYTAVLAAAPGQFGDDAVEIEQLGGTRSSARKHPVRKPKPNK